MCGCNCLCFRPLGTTVRLLYVPEWWLFGYSEWQEKAASCQPRGKSCASDCTYPAHTVNKSEGNGAGHCCPCGMECNNQGEAAVR